MPRPPVIERARLYVAKMPAAVSGGGGHNATFAVACALVKGFQLFEMDARALLDEFNQRCDPPWQPHELDHKIRSAQPKADEKVGYLLDGDDDRSGEASEPMPAARAKKEKPKFNREILERVSGDWAKTVDLVWLANRSYIEPSLVNSGAFLRHIFREGEYVVIFNEVDREGNAYTQGEALWPDDEELPSTGKAGVWFLCQPTDGKYHPNPRSLNKKTGNPRMSRRSEESVTDWRYLVLESDEAPARLWLGALAQLPLRIAAIYTSGGRSVHALVRVDAVTKSSWDDEKHTMKEGLVTLGADLQAMSAVRLTRLPGAYREGKFVEVSPDQYRYERFAQPALQKLLYLNPKPELTPLCDLLARRNVEEDWLRFARAGVSESDETGGAWLKKGLGYYANVSSRLKHALLCLENGAEVSA